MASCRGLPVMLAALGVGTAAVYNVDVLAAPHRAFLLAVAVICLASGAVLLARQRRMAILCAPGGVCPKLAIHSLIVVGLLLGSVLLDPGYSYA